MDVPSFVSTIQTPQMSTSFFKMGKINQSTIDFPSVMNSQRCKSCSTDHNALVLIYQVNRLYQAAYSQQISRLYPMSQQNTYVFEPRMPTNVHT